MKPAATPRSTLSRALLDRFFQQCNWTHGIWLMRHALIDGNRRKRTLERGPHMRFISDINAVLSEYVALQVAKLHDPPVVAGRVTMTLDFVLEYGGWDASTQRKLTRLKKSLDRLGKILRVPRNKLIAHNDLAAVMEDDPVGAFPVGVDKLYFKALWQFLRTAHIGATGERCADFSQFSRADATAVVNALAADSRLKPRRRRRRAG